MPERITLEVSRDGWTDGLQLSIQQTHENGGGHGYRLAGPKFNGSGKTLLTRELNQRDADEIRTYLDAAFPNAVWWLDLDSSAVDPEVFVTEDAARADAVRVYREANDIGLFADDPETVFDWRKHRDGGTELYVDGEATGLIVRQLTVKGAAGPVSVDG